MSRFGEMLRTQRELLGISQRSLADRIGENFSHSYIAKIESGDRVPPQNPAVLDKLSVVLQFDRDTVYLLASCIPGELIDMLLNKPNLMRLLRQMQQKELTNEEIDELTQIADQMQK